MKGKQPRQRRSLDEVFKESDVFAKSKLYGNVHISPYRDPKSPKSKRTPTRPNIFTTTNSSSQILGEFPVKKKPILLEPINYL